MLLKESSEAMRIKRENRERWEWKDFAKGVAVHIEIELR